MRIFRFIVYILTNRSGTLYVGVTKDADIRIWQHENKINVNSFTAKYNINKLIYYEEYKYIEEAILREKQIKRWGRKKKLALVKTINPEFVDLLNRGFRV